MFIRERLPRFPCDRDVDKIHAHDNHSEVTLEAIPHAPEFPPSSEDWVVLLTMCFKRPSPEDQLEHEAMYLDRLNKWLNETQLFIFVIESSGYELHLSHPRLSYISFVDLEQWPSTSSSRLEANALVHAVNEMQNHNAFKTARYVLKVTGRYFLEDISAVLSIKPTATDPVLYLQRHRGKDWQHSEYYGMKTQWFRAFAYMARGAPRHVLMESILFQFSEINNWEYLHPEQGFPNRTPRGGAKDVVDPL